MQLGAFVMTFDRPLILRSTLHSLLAQSRTPDLIIVVDNKADEETRAVVAEYKGDKVEWHAMPENLGPAGAAAYALEILSQRGYDWIYWSDDDDPPKTVDTLERLQLLILSANSDVGAVGAVGTRWDWNRGRVVRLPDGSLRGVLEVDTIAGGSQLILRREAIVKVGLPDSRLFFGFEEPEFCLRLGRAGYRLLVDGDLMYEYRRIAGRINLKRKRAIRPQVPIQSLWRRYYATRNYVFAMRTTFERPDLARREAAKALLRSVAAWGNGPRYGWKFSALQMRGLFDGYFGRLGRRVEPEQKRPVR